MEKNYIMIGAAVVLLLIVIFFSTKKTKKREIPIENVIASYFYRYGGEIQWIKSKLENYKFKSLSSMLLCHTAEEADFRIDVLEDDGTKFLNVYATEFAYSKKDQMECIIKNLKLTDAQYELLLQNVRNTYVATGATATKRRIVGIRKK